MAPRAASKRVASKAVEPPTADSPMPEADKPSKRPRQQTTAAEATEDCKVPQQSKRPRKSKAATGKGGSDSILGPQPGSRAVVPESDDNGGDAAAQSQSPDSNDDGEANKVKAKPKPKSKPRAKEGSCSTSAAEPRSPPGPRYFLMKSEPEEFSLDDLAAKPDQTSHWEGVRNAQARNIMKSMRLGDQAFFYHSSCKCPAVVGVVRVVQEAYPDHFAFDKSSKYHDPSSTPEAPKWWMVDVQLVRRMARPVTLAELRQEGSRGPPIADMVLINKSRLSVQPVTAEQWQYILQLEQQGGREEGAGEAESLKGQGKEKGKKRD